MSDEDPLDDFLDAARADAPAPPAALLRRIAADAAAETERRRPAPAPRRRGPRGVLAALGGLPALAGLAAATMAGVWIGVTQPLGVDPLTALGAGLGSADLSQGYADIALEGWDEG